MCRKPFKWFRKYSKGCEHDELQWIDVQLHSCKILNNQDNVLSLTAGEVMSADSNYIDYAVD